MQVLFYNSYLFTLINFIYWLILLMDALPIKFRTLFWDVNFDELEWEKHKKYIAERILNFGDWDDVLWLKDRMSEKELIALVNSSREINRKTKNYWNTRIS